MTTPSTKFGIFDFGYIGNGSTFIQELNELLVETNQVADYVQFNKDFYNRVTKNEKISFLNLYGKNKDKGNVVITKERANYAYFETGYKNKSGSPILGYFFRRNVKRGFEGIFFGSIEQLNDTVSNNLLFKIGQLVFDHEERSWDDGFSFLDELAQEAIYERWDYGNRYSSVPHPILKSYVENIFIRLRNEEKGAKILMDDNHKFILFNSGLLNLYFKSIYVVAEIKTMNGREIFANPFVLRNRTKLAEINFSLRGRRVSDKDLPEPAQFYNDINEIVFKPEPEYYDPDTAKLEHIIEERRARFPDDFKDRSTTELAVALDNAVKCSYELAKRNFKLVVPQYRPQEDKIQYLMPIYLRSKFDTLPDFALILNYELGYYKPETILELDDAYQNARLIAKPDSFWLNPDSM